MAIEQAAWSFLEDRAAFFRSWSSLLDAQEGPQGVA